MSPRSVGNVSVRSSLAIVALALVTAVLGCGDTQPTAIDGGSSTSYAQTTATAAPTTTLAPTTTVAPTTTAAPTTTTAAPTTTTQTHSDRPPAPEFSGVTLSGMEVSLDSFAGRPLVLVFWSSG